MRRAVNTFTIGKTSPTRNGSMCGIFGFSFKRPVSMDKVFRALRKLEANQLPQEPQPVGGYGAGMAILMEDGSVLVEKVGKIGKSPAVHLPEIVR